MARRAAMLNKSESPCAASQAPVARFLLEDHARNLPSSSESVVFLSTLLLDTYSLSGTEFAR